jgi:hypothetical protein
MNNKQLGIALLVIGVIILLLSLLANSIGIGGAPGFGYKQIAGTVVGAIIAIVGYVLFSRK